MIDEIGIPFLMIGMCFMTMRVIFDNWKLRDKLMDLNMNVHTITIDGKRYRRIPVSADVNIAGLFLDKITHELIPLEENMSKCSKCEFLEMHPLQGLKTCKEHTPMEENIEDKVKCSHCDNFLEIHAVQGLKYCKDHPPLQVIATLQGFKPTDAKNATVEYRNDSLEVQNAYIEKMRKMGKKCYYDGYDAYVCEDIPGWHKPDDPSGSPEQLTVEQQIRISALHASLQAFSIHSEILINNGCKVSSLAEHYAKFITHGEIPE